MHAKAFIQGLLAAVLTVGCRDAADQLKSRRLTVDLIRSLSEMDMQLSNEEDSLKFLNGLGKSAIEQAAVIENARRRVSELRAEIYRHSNFERPLVDQIRYEELDHERLFDRFNKIVNDHSKGMRRAKEQMKLTRMLHTYFASS